MLGRNWSCRETDFTHARSHLTRSEPRRFHGPVSQTRALSSSSRSILWMAIRAVESRLRSGRSGRRITTDRASNCDTTRKSTAGRAHARLGRFFFPVTALVDPRLIAFVARCVGIERSAKSRLGQLPTDRYIASSPDSTTGLVTKHRGSSP